MSYDSYCIANWKMNQTNSSILVFMNKLREEIIGNPDIVPIICPSYIHIDQVNSYTDNNNFFIHGKKQQKLCANHSTIKKGSAN